MNSFKEKVTGKRPSPALIISILALFVALGGTSYAAMKVNGKNITNRSISGKKIQTNTLTTKEVKNKSLLKADFKPGQIPAGAQGPPGVTGAPGAPGAPGATSVVMRKGPITTIGSGNFQKLEVSCLTGEKATGGGIYNESQVASMVVTSSYPIPNPTSPPATGDGIAATGWRGWMENNSATNEPAQAYVICVSP